eukprot:6181957-Pleurochrysis_carterae.AAC.1
MRVQSSLEHVAFSELLLPAGLRAVSTEAHELVRKANATALLTFAESSSSHSVRRRGRRCLRPPASAAAAAAVGV